MINQSYPCFYPGEFSPPTKYHLNAVHWLLSKPEVHRINIVLGASAPGQLSQDQKARLWEMLLKSKFSPQAGIIKAKANGPMSEIYEAFNKDKKLPAFVALDEKASRNRKLQERFESFPYFGIQIIPSQFHVASKQLMTAAQNKDLQTAKKCLPDDFDDDAINHYMDIIYPKKQDPEAPEEKSPYVDYKSRYMSMFNDGFWKSVFQPMSDEALNEGVIKDDIKNKALEKFKKENPALTDNQIKRYIDSFEKNMEKPIVKKKDILQYKWDELEQLVDGNFGTENISKPESEDIVDFKGSEDVVYNDNGLLILLGDIREKCIRYGQKYSWCISRNDYNNMFYSYRMRMEEPVFYFIFDEDKIEKNPNDKYHAIVIYVNSQEIYTVADATNSGDKEMSWEEIVRIQPKLKDLKSLIKHIPLTAQEKADYEKYKNEVNDEVYKKFTYDEKYKYIQFGHNLTEDQVRNTPKPLISRYVATGIALGMPKDIEKSLSGSDQKLLFKNRKTVMEKENSGEDEDTITKLTILNFYPEKKIDSLKTNGDLDLSGTNITSLPDNLKVGGNLNLMNSKITTWPDNLEVGGDLDLMNSKITTWPDNLKVGGDLDLSGTNITSLPDNLKVGGDLDLSNSDIYSLPDNLEVEGSLYLYKSDISFLPNDLKVGGDLNLIYSDISFLPDNLEVGGIIRISKNQLDTIQDKYKNKIKTFILTEGTIKDDIKKKALEKFKKENPALTDNQIKSYIDSFEYNMDKPIVKKKDILQYAWDELEQLVDGQFGTDIIAKPKSEDLVDFKGSEDVVYNDNKLLILLGDIREKCIRYGQKYSWCISRTDTKNMFYSYRMRMNEPVFYFIFDEDIIEKDPSNIYHAIVIYVNNQGEYMVADAENEGDTEMSWSEIVRIQPKLKKLRHLIKHIPLSAEERADYKKYREPVKDEEYKKYNYDEKYKYIQFGHELSENQIRNTPKPLISRLVATGLVRKMPEDVHDSLSGSDKKILYKNRRQSIDKGQQYKDENDETKHILTYLLFYNKVISDNLEVRGDLDLLFSKITSLPNNLKVRGSLNLSNSKITSLPNNLKVGGNLILTNTDITSLPDNLKVGVYLDLSGTKITSLPDNIKLGGTLNLNNSKITSLPDNLKVKGNLDLANTKITSLPDNLEVGLDLNLYNTKITSLPNNLKVGASLYIHGTNITSLPDNLEVVNNIYTREYQLDKIKIQDKFKNKIKIY